MPHARGAPIPQSRGKSRNLGTPTRERGTIGRLLDFKSHNRLPHARAEHGLASDLRRAVGFTPAGGGVFFCRAARMLGASGKFVTRVPNLTRPSCTCLRGRARTQSLLRRVVLPTRVRSDALGFFSLSRNPAGRESRVSAAGQQVVKLEPMPARPSTAFLQGPLLDLAHARSGDAQLLRNFVQGYAIASYPITGCFCYACCHCVTSNPARTSASSPRMPHLRIGRARPPIVRRCSSASRPAFHQARCQSPAPIQGVPGSCQPVGHVGLALAFVGQVVAVPTGKDPGPIEIQDRPAPATARCRA